MTDALTTTAPAVLDAAVDAALRMARDAAWRDLTLRDIAAAAGVSFADLYARASGKEALLDHLSRRYDAAVLAAAADPSPEVADRLFEAVMARLEAMEPDRLVLIAIARDARFPGPDAARRAAATARAFLEAAGIDAGGPRGALRVAAMVAVWARTLRVWQDDEGALNRTMAEIDRLLKTLRKRLGQIGAGF